MVRCGRFHIYATKYESLTLCYTPPYLCGPNFIVMLKWLRRFFAKQQPTAPLPQPPAYIPMYRRPDYRVYEAPTERSRKWDRDDLGLANFHFTDKGTLKTFEGGLNVGDKVFNGESFGNAYQSKPAADGAYRIKLNFMTVLVIIVKDGVVVSEGLLD